ncbi:YebC/PmpR family DNA-binding transcriptional regulator [Marinifilum flexuosum]|uniref:YebC/PmpR family DNA-binding transcriptional regulator n=1 Tax=Marinifilum flexuosum TaxID=1117708 RepID=UPI002490CE87|nr:YebC/PmpR family DNA-binding transcriptional regulator [Marinifilum flexuosum]
MGRAFEFRKARKMKRWDKMAKAFTRIGKDIVIAVKEGGPDPSTNARLRAVIQNAKAANMPKDNVERAIKKASSKEQKDFKELVYEGYAPHGIAILVETATDNHTRTVADVRSYFNKCKGSLGTAGSVEFMFERKCHFKIENKEYDIEELEFELIDLGVEEVFAEEDGVMLYGEFTDFGKIQAYLEENDMTVISSGFERIPMDTKELPEDQVADVEKLLEKLEDNDDVQNVYHNMA